jgi:hypothetical protein
MTKPRESDRSPLEHPALDDLADVVAGEDVGDPSSREQALEHLRACPQCAERVRALGRVGELLREAPVPAPTELEWARMLSRVRQSRVPTWRMLAAAAILAVAIPATLAWLLPPRPLIGSGGDLTAPALESAEI